MTENELFLNVEGVSKLGISSHAQSLLAISKNIPNEVRENLKSLLKTLEGKKCGRILFKLNKERLEVFFYGSDNDLGASLSVNVG